MRVCTECGTRSFEERRAGPHMGLYCANCGKWVKWLVQIPIEDPAFVMPFGPYKGTKISMLPTPYICKMRGEATGSMKERFDHAYHHRALLFCMYLFEVFSKAPHNGNGWVLKDDLRIAFMNAHKRTTDDGYALWFGYALAGKVPAYELRMNQARNMVMMKYHPENMDPK